jgi:pimeloyl-ACP methyl ester carboxylesterase
VLIAAGCGGNGDRPAAGTTGSPAGSWVGSYALGGPGRLALTFDGAHGHVALGVGHADFQVVPVSFASGAVHFSLPGRPRPLTFDGTVAAGRITGAVQQGTARGTFSLRPGQAPDLLARGVFRTSAGLQAVVDDPYGPARLVDLETGAVHALYPAAPGFVIGSGFASRAPTIGTAQLGGAKPQINGRPARRVPTRQLEVRFRSGATTLSGTLSVPATPGSSAGKHAAVAFVHGSGLTNRAYLPDLQALLLANGVAVLAYDKRGVGQSGGTYPGESPTSETIDTLALDAEAAARFLAAQPEIDPARVGLAGHSQAGWIIPLAATREPAIHFVIVFSGPTVTADEVDLFQTLTGQGEHPSALSDAAIDAQVLARGRSGVDPIPWIRKLTIPGLWVYGGRDRHIPPQLSEHRLRPIADAPGHDFTIATFPNANHALVETRTGLLAEMLRSKTFAPGLFELVGQWLAAHALSGPSASP